MVHVNITLGTDQVKNYLTFTDVKIHMIDLHLCCSNVRRIKVRVSIHIAGNYKICVLSIANPLTACGPWIDPHEAINASLNTQIYSITKCTTPSALTQLYRDMKMWQSCIGCLVACLIESKKLFFLLYCP